MNAGFCSILCLDGRLSDETEQNRERWEGKGKGRETKEWMDVQSTNPSPNRSPSVSTAPSFLPSSSVLLPYSLVSHSTTILISLLKAIDEKEKEKGKREGEGDQNTDIWNVLTYSTHLTYLSLSILRMGTSLPSFVNNSPSSLGLQQRQKETRRQDRAITMARFSGQQVVTLSPYLS